MQKQCVWCQAVSLSSLSPYTSLLRPFLSLLPLSLSPPLSFIPSRATLGIKPGTLYLFGKRRIIELRSQLSNFFSSFSSHPWLGGEFLSGSRADLGGDSEVRKFFALNYTLFFLLATMTWGSLSPQAVLLSIL